MLLLDLEQPTFIFAKHQNSSKQVQSYQCCWHAPDAWQTFGKGYTNRPISGLMTKITCDCLNEPWHSRVRHFYIKWPLDFQGNLEKGEPGNQSKLAKLTADPCMWFLMYKNIHLYMCTQFSRMLLLLYVDCLLALIAGWFDLSISAADYHRYIVFHECWSYRKETQACNSSPAWGMIMILTLALG